MRSLLATSLLVLAASTAQAHICLTYPLMRGAEHPNLMPGDELCYQRTPDCGNLKKGPTTATFIAGTPSVVGFQQNLNHFWPGKPGNFDLAVSYDDEKSWIPIASNVSDFPANNMNTQSMFGVPVVFPMAADSAVVRARYISNNQNEVVPDNNTDAIFYSCADVKIVKASASSPGTLGIPAPGLKVKKNHNKKTLKNPPQDHPKSCTTPDRWSAIGIETNLYNHPVMTHSISYDTVYGMMKWERSNKDFGGSYLMVDYWNMTLLSAGYTPQHIYGLNGPDTCVLYGGDTFYKWAYGEIRNQTINGYGCEGTDCDELIMVYSNLDNGMDFEAVFPKGTSDYCLPSSQTTSDGSVIGWISQAVDSFPEGTFTLPKACSSKTEVEAGCMAHKFGRKHLF